MKPRQADKLREIFNSRFLNTEVHPKIEHWDATDEECLTKNLQDGTEWVVIIPNWLNPAALSATWLISHGLAIPYIYWTQNPYYRMYVMGNAWREMFQEGSPFFAKFAAEHWHKRIEPLDHMAGFKVFRWKAGSQKDRILSKMRQVYMSTLEECGSMSMTDTANCMMHGTGSTMDYRSLPASTDAIEKSLLFIGTQLNWIRNPSFITDGLTRIISSQPGSNATSEIRDLFDKNRSEYFSKDVIWFDAPSIHSFLCLVGLAEKLRPEAHELINYFLGTHLFAWSYIYGECMSVLAAANSHGIMGNVNDTVLTAMKESTVFRSITDIDKTLGSVSNIRHEIDAFYAVTAFDMYLYSDASHRGSLSYIKFPHTWLKQVTGRAIYLAAKRTKFCVNGVPIITGSPGGDTYEYLESHNFNTSGSFPVSAQFTNLPKLWFPNIIDLGQEHPLLKLPSKVTK